MNAPAPRRERTPQRRIQRNQVNGWINFDKPIGGVATPFAIVIDAHGETFGIRDTDFFGRFALGEEITVQRTVDGKTDAWTEAELRELREGAEQVLDQSIEINNEANEL